jgi:hypothetical protein
MKPSRRSFYRPIPSFVGRFGGLVAYPLFLTITPCSLASPLSCMKPRRLVKTFIAIVAWCVLFALCWPLALLALVLWPIIWLLALPFRLVGITFGALFALLQALLLLPARLLGWRPSQAQPRQAATT